MVRSFPSQSEAIKVQPPVGRSEERADSDDKRSASGGPAVRYGQRTEVDSEFRIRHSLLQMPVLDNPSHEAFAQELAKGKHSVDAYRVVKGNKTGARVVGPRWAKLPNVAARVLELQKATSAGNVLSALERREFLARCVRADLNALDLAADGDLIQEKITTETEHGVTVKVKLPGKRECVMSDAELAGELKTGVSVSISVDVREPLDQLRERLKTAQPRHARN